MILWLLFWELPCKKTGNETTELPDFPPLFPFLVQLGMIGQRVQSDHLTLGDKGQYESKLFRFVAYNFESLN